MSSEDVVRGHVAAFNARDIEGLMACFGHDVTWTTGTDTFRGVTALRSLFEAAFRDLAPTLRVRSMLVDGDRVACELHEDLVVGGAARVDHIAGFYRVESGRIVGATIYREGSAEV